MILLVKGEPLGRKGLTEPICPSLFLNPFPPRATKSIHFVIVYTVSNVRRFYSSNESLWVGKGFNVKYGNERIKRNHQQIVDACNQKCRDMKGMKQKMEKSAENLLLLPADDKSD